MRIFTVLLTILALALVSCGKREEQSQSEAGPIFDANVESVVLDGTPATVGGVYFVPPAEWTDLGESGMRKANYDFGPVGDDAEPANVAVYYFGVDQGGPVEANIDRWISQVRQANGEPAPAIRDKMEINGIPVTTVEVAGNYSGGMGIGMGGQPKADYLVVGAVAEGPQGNVFFKLTGPEESAEAMARGFVAMIKALKVEPEAGA